MTRRTTSLGPASALRRHGVLCRRRRGMHRKRRRTGNGDPEGRACGLLPFNTQIPPLGVPQADRRGELVSRTRIETSQEPAVKEGFKAWKWPSHQGKEALSDPPETSPGERSWNGPVRVVGRVPSPGGNVPGPSRLWLDHVQRQDSAATFHEAQVKVEAAASRVPSMSLCKPFPSARFSHHATPTERGPSTISSCPRVFA